MAKKVSSHRPGDESKQIKGKVESVSKVETRAYVAISGDW
jgi:hypothetical protein